MERATGIGGFFFRSSDPELLGNWYATNLGVGPPPRPNGRFAQLSDPEGNAVQRRESADGR